MELIRLEQSYNQLIAESKCFIKREKYKLQFIIIDKNTGNTEFRNKKANIFRASFQIVNLSTDSYNTSKNYLPMETTCSGVF